MTSSPPPELGDGDRPGRRTLTSALLQPGAGWRLEKRLNVRPWHELIALLAALGAAVLIIAALVTLIGKNPWESFAALYNGAFGGRISALETLVQATPLIFTGLSAAIAFRAGIWNIGAEGQFFAGTIGTWWAYDLWGGLPAPLSFIIMFAAAALAGAVWSSIAGGLLVRYGTNEILTTVMLNFVILYVLSYLLAGPWQSPGTFYYQTERMDEASFLPRFFSDSRLHWGFALALLTAAAVYFLIRNTTLGYEIRGVGINATASRYKGVRVGMVGLAVMAISGAIAGLAGAGEILGVYHRLQTDFALGVGFTGIIIALVARLHPLWTVAVAIAFGALVNGSTAMQYETGIPSALVQVIEGVALALVLAAAVASRYRIRRTARDG